MSNYKGSNRCILKLISSPDFIRDINSLIADTGAAVSDKDTWLPKGEKEPKEAELFNFINSPITAQLGKEIQSWWLEVDTSNPRTPNWDLVSTCTVNGKAGILLVEAKAHESELHDGGKRLESDASENSRKNHERIRHAIMEANSEINKAVQGVSISRDKCYQLSNRVAHSWWLASHGIPVVLLYLGFLKAEDMRSSGYIVFDNPQDWEKCFMNHAKQVGVDNIINVSVDCGNSSFVTIVKSL